MKAGVLAAAAALAVGVSAAGHHQHESFHKRGAFARSINDTLGEYNNQIPAKNGSEECGCYTVWVTSYGEPTGALITRFTHTCRVQLTVQ